MTDRNPQSQGLVESRYNSGTLLEWESSECVCDTADPLSGGHGKQRRTSVGMRASQESERAVKDLILESTGQGERPLDIGSKPTSGAGEQ